MSGGKWLAVGTAGLLVLLAVLWYEMQETPAVAAPAVAAAAAPEPQAAARAPTKAYRAIAAIAAAEEQKQSGKVDPASDQFFYRFTEQVPAVVSSAMMQKCYHGGLHRRSRDQLITLDFIDHIKNGEVTVSDVKVKESSLDDPEMEACMVDAVAHSHWHDDSLPDIQQQDEVTLTPERGGKKYMKEDIDYVGPAAPPNTPR